MPVTASLPEIDLDSIDISLLYGLLRGIKPDPFLKVSEWADTFRTLPPTVAEPGPFRTSRTPYLREIMDKLSVADPAQKIIFKKCSQIGATESGNNWLGYIIDIAPASTLYIMPTDSMMKKTSKTRIGPMIKDSERLSKKIKPARSREGGNTILEKEFEGGMVNMVGANSPVGLSSTPVRYVYADEVDRYPLDVGGEGDVIGLAETRTVSFGARKKIFITSTPTLDGSSIIDSEFEKTGQRYFNVPCPHCAAMQVLKFDQLRYEEGKFDDVKYECEHCKEGIAERFKAKMLQNGQWAPEFPEKEDGITFGYHLNALYSPPGWYSWAQMAREYEAAQNNLPKLIVFTNTKMGDVYKNAGDQPDWQQLYNKREQYPLNRPDNSVVFITAGVDIQKDRIELEVVGWGKGKQSWSIDYRVLPGNTDTSDAPVWESLSKVLDEGFIREDGAVLQIRYMAVDTGYNTSIVYDFCRKYSGRVLPIKGQENQNLMVTPPRTVDTSRAGKKIKGIKIWNVGTSMIKTEIYGWLKLQQKEDGTYPYGYCHFPQYDSHFFKSLASEKLERKVDKKGYTVYTWVKKFERNEALDCRVYARAAAYVLGIDRLKADAWDKALIDTQDLIPEKSGEIKQPKAKTKRKSDYWN